MEILKLIYKQVIVKYLIIITQMIWKKVKCY